MLDRDGFNDHPSSKAPIDDGHDHLSGFRAPSLGLHHRQSCDADHDGDSRDEGQLDGGGRQVYGSGTRAVQIVTVSFDTSEDDKAVLRVIARRVLEQSEGTYVAPWDVLDDVVLDASGVDLESLTTDRIAIINGFWGQSRTSGEDKYVAYSLGDDTWYVFYTNAADEVMFHGIVPGDERDEGFKEITRDWINVYARAAISLPTEFSSIYKRELWFIRTFAEALAGNERDAVESIQNDLLKMQDMDSASEAIHDCWWTATGTTQGADDDVVPGLASPSNDESDQEFDAWLDRVELTWRDTGDPLDISSARSLRLTCQFLGLTD